MRLLLDECVPKRLKREFPGHEVTTVSEAGWAGVENGKLLRAADGLFEVLVTVDQRLQYQQNMTGLRISVLVLVAPSNDIDDLRPLLPSVVEAADTDSARTSHANRRLAMRAGHLVRPVGAATLTAPASSE